MKSNRFFSFVAFAAIFISACSPRHAGTEASITIFYDNDVHCAVDGYATVAALRDAERANTPYVALVSAGDYLQGGSIGAASSGGYIVDIMNEVHYDMVTLGNHEFDYGMPRLAELSKKLNTTISCCNLFDLRRGEPGRMMYKPYIMKRFGKVDVAFVGIATPYSFVSSNPTYFQNENGEYVYSLSSENFYAVVQDAIDHAREHGAEYVIAVGHLGDNAEEPMNALTMIENTTGLDAVIDGHAHNLIPGQFIKDKSGKDVLHTSTGSHFENVGKMTISPDGKFSTQMIEVGENSPKSVKVSVVTDKIKEEYKKQGARVIGESQVEFIYADEESPRLVRIKETGLGNFCADVFRYGMRTDIALLGGGGVRAPIHKGTVTFDDIFKMFPFGNTVAVAEISGRQIVDALEFSAWVLPVDFGGFLQVSGLKFTIDVRVDTPVVVDANKAFVGFSGPERRVSNVQVEQADGSYAPIDLDHIYTVAGSTYTLKEHGDGFDVLKGIKVTDTGMIDLQLLEKYIVESLDKVIPERYAAPEGRITIIPRK